MQIVEEMWKEYEKNEIPIIMSLLDRQERQKAFLSGILAVYSLMNSAEESKLSNKKIEELMNSVFNESFQALAKINNSTSQKQK